MKSAVTICLVPEARQGPFVFHDGLEAGCRMAAELGFDAVEVFPESAEGLPVADLHRLLATHGKRCEEHWAASAHRDETFAAPELASRISRNSHGPLIRV
jgi:hypothetical protein